MSRTDAQSLLLMDGRTVAVRPAAPGDEERIAALFEGLSPLSRAMRFGAMRQGLTSEEARAMATAGAGGVALLVLSGAEFDRPVALARYDRRPGAPEAELAMAVADAWQGRGVGTALLERLLRQAHADGVDALWALVRPDNRRMLNMLRDLGCDLEREHRSGEVTLRLPTSVDDDLEEASIGRFARAAAASLEPMMRPRSIAVVGDPAGPGSPAAALVEALVASGFAGPVTSVGPGAGGVAGAPAAPSLAALPAPVDLVVAAVPAGDAPAVARQAVGRGARAMIVTSAGFAEAGAEGAALEAELLRVVRTGGMRMIGPNCLGVSSTAPPFEASLAPSSPRPGHIAIASQSGGVNVAALAYYARRGVGLSALVSLGNKADVSSNDMLAWWEGDERTRVVLLYMEGFGNPRRFARLARRVSRTTPIVALKAGRGPAGRRGTGSHTAALAAAEAPSDALFDLAGVVRVTTARELLEAGELLAAQPLPAGNRVAVLTNAGGHGVLAVDACETNGLVVPPLSPRLAAALARAAPGIAGASNPVDLGAGAAPRELAEAGRLLRDSGEADALVVVVAPVRGRDQAAAMRAVQELADGSLPIVGCAGGEEPGAVAPDAARPVPWFALPESAARALGNAARAAAAARRPADPTRRPEGLDRAAARAVLGRTPPGGQLPDDDVAEMLAAYGIAVGAAGAPREAGVDLMVGAAGDPVFGPLVLAGIGGVEAGLWRDRGVALAPVGPVTAAELWGGLRGAELLDGGRDAPGADRQALADLVARVGWLAADQPLLGELECDPVRAPAGGRAVVLRARAARAPESG
ncbi:GNAT family N-acetyltransferase [Miltoncostaea marina]|uniref:GNAT family N-acetyltransferase n=1 Tax=Miltoncostaea marina TaxID=2843215 RepID=UPI001C3CBA26|nr:GNAT family N-acetyltransferase [Miltoncostaea marina]